MNFFTSLVSLSEAKREMKKEIKQEIIRIPPPNFETALFTIRGDTKLVIHKFSEKARKGIMEKQMLGSRAKKGQKLKPRDFEQEYEDAKYVYNNNGNSWCGIPAVAFRNAMISACKIVGFYMTKGKLAIFIEPDGFDTLDNRPLVKITKGKPHRHDDYGRLPDGTPNLCSRPMWDEGWEAVVRVRYDADMFSRADISSLLMRAGLQVGIGEGRPDSKKSCGCGWGTFVIKGDDA